jgi:hypothetical protein
VAEPVPIRKDRPDRRYSNLAYSTQHQSCMLMHTAAAWCINGPCCILPETKLLRRTGKLSYLHYILIYYSLGPCVLQVLTLFWGALHWPKVSVLSDPCAHISKTQMLLDGIRDLRCLDCSCLTCSKIIKNLHLCSRHHKKHVRAFNLLKIL